MSKDSNGLNVITFFKTQQNTRITHHFNPSLPGALFKYVRSFSEHQELKGSVNVNEKIM